jgi:hypothetical protein
MQWWKARLMARSVAFDHETADAAIAYAIQKGWLIGVGEPPHSAASQTMAAAHQGRRGQKQEITE